MLPVTFAKASIVDRTVKNQEEEEDDDDEKEEEEEEEEEVLKKKIQHPIGKIV